MWETLFFASGSIFFLLSIFILLITGFFVLKIGASALSIEREIKSLADDLKSKVNALSITFAGVVALLEKLIQYKKESQKESRGDENEGGSKRGAKKIKIASLDEE